MPKKVLIVDGDESLSWSVAKTLARDRDICEVKTACDSLTALDMLKGMPFDLAVLEAGLPGINGLDLIVRIKQETPSTKVMMTGSICGQAMKEKARARGAMLYISKPFDLEQMRASILKALNEDVEQGFNGSIQGLRLPDLIQMNCLGQVTTALHIINDIREGVIYFEDGQIMHAAVGAMEGEEAFFSMLSWQSGSFKFSASERAPKVTVSNNWEYLLIEGMRKADEMAIRLEKGEFTDDMTASIDEPTKMLVKDISRLPEFSGLVLTAQTGEMIYKTGGFSDGHRPEIISGFFMNLDKYLSGIIDSAPVKTTFTNQGSITLVYPFRLHTLALEFSRPALAPDTLSGIEKIISLYQI